MNSFYLTLPSDSSIDFFPNNTQCCFKVKLPKTIYVGKENWEVALSQLITPSQFLNFSEREAKFEIVTSDLLLYKHLEKVATEAKYRIYEVKPVGFAPDNSPNKWVARFTFPAGSYISPSHVLEVINEIIDDSISETIR